MTRARLPGAAALAASLFAFWLLLSGIYTPFLVLSGLGASIAVAAFAQGMEVADREGHPIHL
ncbi:MAG TPA: hypothetical protein VJ690_07845, partial [Burkholderiales bacterium]|nr:hypothetical protein [Burkholderiales bacterium]